jgi:hypothetical protein
MKFTLTIELGNDAMRSYQDLRDALKRVGTKLGSRQHCIKGTPSDGDGSKVMDANGNSVGEWKIEPTKLRGGGNCEACQGYGNVTKRLASGSRIEPCKRCKGTGSVRAKQTLPEPDWKHSAQFMTERDPSKTGPGLGEEDTICECGRKPQDCATFDGADDRHMDRY